jgi:hypothetical protein
MKTGVLAMLGVGIDSIWAFFVGEDIILPQNNLNQMRKSSPVAQVALQEKNLLFDFAGCANTVISTSNE